MSGVKSSAIAAQRPLPAELLGTALLVTVVVGCGIAAARLSPSDSGLQLPETALRRSSG
jgi:glycerol uptake facilitator-like aquaporin